MKYLDLLLKENLIRQTSFLRKVHLQKPTSFRLKDSHFAHFFENGNKVKIPSEIKVPTFNCLTECKKTPGCVGFTFVSSIDRCDLKNDDQAVELDYNNGDSIFSGTLKLRPGTGWHNSRGSINSIVEVRAEKASQCENPCRDTSGCVGWTYVKVGYFLLF